MKIIHDSNGYKYIRFCYYENLEEQIKEFKVENQRLKAAGNKVVEMFYCIDGMMDEKDMNNLWDAIKDLEKQLEE